MYVSAYAKLFMSAASEMKCGEAISKTEAIATQRVRPLRGLRSASLHSQ